ncbi:MAG: esterase-like activity of phytase family protein [Acidimicrobiales bacterium]
MKLGIAVVVINFVSALTVPTVAWPGSTAVRVVDQADVLGGNISGLTVAGPSSLWAVRDGPSALSRLDRSAAGWAPSRDSNGSRALQYADGSGSPDAEAVTTAAGDDTVVFVGAERDSDKPNTSRNSILRFDTSGVGTLRATQQWELGSVLPATGANAGIEGLTWIADDVFVAMGFRDATGKTYVPADYPGHGRGLFVVGLEQNGVLYVTALGDDGGVALVASMPSGLSTVMEVVWSPARQELWAICDNTCDGVAAVLRPSDGTFALSVIVQPPPGMASLNNEGFAFGPSCADNTMTAVWADDGAAGGHVIREATLSCTAIAIAGAATAPTTLPPPSTKPFVENRPNDSPSNNDRSLAVLVGLAVVLTVGLTAAIALLRRTRRPR